MDAEPEPDDQMSAERAYTWMQMRYRMIVGLDPWPDRAEYVDTYRRRSIETPVIHIRPDGSSELLDGWPDHLR